MKRFICMLFVCLSMFCLYGCSSARSDIPKGYVSKEEHFDKDGWQDFTDYCKYSYNRMPITEDSQYRRITESDVEDMKGYFSNFRGWMEAGDRLEEYDFDDSCITEGDYVFIKTKEGETIGKGSYTYGRYDNYSVYFFDVDSLTLFYIHSNI